MGAGSVYLAAAVGGVDKDKSKDLDLRRCGHREIILASN
jgi:hypothetical protein